VSVPPRQRREPATTAHDGARTRAHRHESATLRRAPRARPHDRRNGHELSARVTAAPGARSRLSLAGALRWLWADARTVVEIEHRSGASRGDGQAAGAAAPADLRRGLARWRARVERRRGLVLLRRHLLVALVLACAAEIGLVLAGADRRSLWLLTALVPALVDIAYAATRRVTRAQVARMLDRDLDLRNRIDTALELSDVGAHPPNAGSRLADEAGTSLAGRVAVEANAALASSFGRARVHTRPARGEWAWLLGAAVVLVLLVALPGINGHSNGASRLAGAGSRALLGGRRGAGAAGSLKHVKPAALPVGASVDNAVQNALHAAPPEIANGTTGPQPTGNGTSPYGHGGHSAGASPAGSGLASPDVGTKVLAAPGSGAASGAGKSTATVAATNTGKSGSTSGAGSTGGLSNPGASVTSTPSAVRAGGKGGTTPGRAGASSSAANGAQSSAHSGAAPPGGESAGAARGSSALVAGLTPDLPQGSAGLPLQAGYAPSTSKQSSSSGVSQTPNGGGGAGRTAQTNDASGAANGTGFTVIPPTPNSSAAVEQSLLSDYFGSANQLQPGAW
jgi:hypothetical protein